MRILMLTQFYPPILGGLERYVKDLSEELVIRGHSVSVVTQWQAGWLENLPEYEEKRGVRIYRIKGSIHRLNNLIYIDSRRNYAPPFPDPEMSFAIRKIIQEEKPEIVHAHNWLIHSFLPLKNWSKAKLVVTFHDYHLQCAKWIMIRNDQICTGPQFNKCLSCMIANYGSLKGILTVLGHRATQKLYANSVDMFIPVSQAVAEGNHLPQNQLPYKVISNFIPDKYPQEQEIEDYLEQLPQKEFMLFVGAFSPLKGFDILLEAYRIIETDMPLVFIGYELNEYALAQYDVPENVYFLKHWPNPAVMEAWKRSAIGIVPSTGPDSSPTVVMEAMYGETPVIGTQVGGIPDIIIDGETGILIPHNNIEALRKAIQVLLDNPERRKQMGKRGKQHVEKFQASFVVGEIEAIYHQLKINN